MKNVELTPREFDALAQALYVMIKWDVGGMYGDGSDIVDKSGLTRAIRVLTKLGYAVPK